MTGCAVAERCVLCGGFAEGIHMRVLVLLLLVAGCAANPGTWSKPGVTQPEFERDKYACLIDSKTGDGGYDSRVFDACMGVKGYLR